MTSHDAPNADPRTAVATSAAPQPSGNYSQGVCFGNLVFLSGQLPLDPATNRLVEGSPVEMYRQCLRNLEMVCVAAGGSIRNIVKLNVYYIDISYSKYLDEVIPEFFSQPYPARIRVVVKELSKRAAIEIDGIMALGPSA
jgi:reactive intermediate/imine deaminase